jgi:hypothetical protein
MDVHALEIEKLVMPGPVIAAHAKFETDCRSCHVAFAKARQNALCLDCHEEVAKDLKAAVGFHGKSPNVVKADCASCHTDHQGRSADIVLLDKDTFDHRLTDFPLHGAHQGVACGDCHGPEKLHREASSQCSACHRPDDVHKGELGEKCATCHNEQDWRSAVTTFDHARSTKYPLLGGHVGVACGLCHADRTFKSTPTACIDCHRDNDVHAGRNGSDCASCHSVQTWKTQTFNHARETDFPLLGEHARVTCVACHTSGDFKAPVKRDCVGCHSGDDSHKGLNGGKCADCHVPDRWSQVNFDHARSTTFPLLGAHQDVACLGCHTGPVYTVRTETACVACHARDDAHARQLGTECGTCHTPVSWTEQVAFDHDLTRFPLIGLHTVVPCEACHVSKDFKGTASGCIDCHAEDDTHKGQLGPTCAACHTPNAWNLWSFDHARQTDFALDGAHDALQCVACHTRPVADKIQLSTRCADCHRRDDVHRGAFGQDCSRCHSTIAFSRPRSPAS